MISSLVADAMLPSVSLADAGAALFYLSEKSAAVSYSLSGRLILDKSGWLIVSVPADFVRGARAQIREHGVELPDLYGIPAMSPSEMTSIGREINERGHAMRYSMGGMVECGSGPIYSKTWCYRVVCPELRKLRVSYGLPPFPPGQESFLLPVAVRCKAATKAKPPAPQPDSSFSPDWSEFDEESVKRAAAGDNLDRKPPKWLPALAGLLGVRVSSLGDRGRGASHTVLTLPGENVPSVLRGSGDRNVPMELEGRGPYIGMATSDVVNEGKVGLPYQGKFSTKDEFLNQLRGATSHIPESDRRPVTLYLSGHGSPYSFVHQKMEEGKLVDEPVFNIVNRSAHQSGNQISEAVGERPVNCIMGSCNTGVGRLGEIMSEHGRDLKITGALGYMGTRQTPEGRNYESVRGSVPAGSTFADGTPMHVYTRKDTGGAYEPTDGGIAVSEAGKRPFFVGSSPTPLFPDPTTVSRSYRTSDPSKLLDKLQELSPASSGAGVLAAALLGRRLGAAGAAAGSAPAAVSLANEIQTAQALREADQDLGIEHHLSDDAARIAPHAGLASMPLAVYALRRLLETKKKPAATKKQSG